MERLKEAQQHLESVYQEFQAGIEGELPELTVDDAVKLEELIETIYRKESLATVKKSNFPFKVSSKLRSAIADVLLLLGGKDHKLARSQAEKSTAEKSTAESDATE